MPIVLYTNEKFDVGAVVDTRDYCELNERALGEASQIEQEVEAFLEEVRREHFPEAPDRLCSVLGIPIPGMTSFVMKDQETSSSLPGATTAIRTPEPPGIGIHCYHIAEASGAQRLSADERYVGKLVDGWERLRGRFQRWELASSYWSGHVLAGYSILIQGPIKIVDECHMPRGGRRLRPVVWEAD